MKIKIVIFSVAVALSTLLPPGVLSGVVAVARAPEPVDHFPQYNFGYSVQDQITGDIKGQSESRSGDIVQGQYSLVEPDGTLRTVTYTADHNGFNAVVDRQVGYSAPAPAPVQIVKARAFAVPALPSIHHPVQTLPPQQIIAVQPPRPIRPVAVIPQRPPQVIQVQPRPPQQIIQPIQVISRPPPQQVIVQQPQPQPPRPVIVAQPPPPTQSPPPPPPPSPPQAVQQPQPPLQPPQQDEFDITDAIEIPSSDFISDTNPPPQQPTLPPPPPPTTQRPRPPPQAVQQPQLPPAATPPPQNFEDIEDAIEISADGPSLRGSGRQAGPSRNGGGSSFTYNSSRGNQFNFRVVA